jgi:hypothetical protein
MTKVTFKVPASSLSELEKIVDGYFVLEKDVSLDEISNLTGMSKTTLSPNHAFLKEVGIIQGGIKKSATPIGAELGNAIHHKLPEEVQKYWKQIVQDNDFLSKVSSTVRIKKGMTTKDFASHILYVAKAPDNKGTRTGANTIVDILIKSGVINEADGKVEYIDSSPIIHKKEGALKSEQSLDELSADELKQQKPSGSEGNFFPNLHIDIQIHIDPGCSLEQIDQIFISMSDHLSKLVKNKNE